MKFRENAKYFKKKVYIGKLNRLQIDYSHYDECSLYAQCRSHDAISMSEAVYSS